MSRFMPVRSRRQGFTIIELMVVIAITGILMALVLAALQKAIAAVCDTACKNGLYNIGRAVHAHNASLQYLPVNGITAPSTPGFANASGSDSPAGIANASGSVSPVGVPYPSIFYQLLPFCDQDTLSKLPYTTAATAPIFLCPSDPSAGPVTSSGYANGFATSSYVGDGAIFVNMRCNLSQASPDSSTTIIMSERLQNCHGSYTAWADPAATVCRLPQIDQYGQPIEQSTLTGVTVQGGANYWTCIIYVPGMRDSTIFQSAHTGKVNVLRADGQVSSISVNCDSVNLNYHLLGAGRDYWGGGAEIE